MKAGLGRHSFNLSVFDGGSPSGKEKGMAGFLTKTEGRGVGNEVFKGENWDTGA